MSKAQLTLFMLVVFSIGSPFVSSWFGSFDRRALSRYLSAGEGVFFSVVPVLLGALVLVCSFVVVKYIVRQIKP